MNKFYELKYATFGAGYHRYHEFSANSDEEALEKANSYIEELKAERVSSEVSLIEVKRIEETTIYSRETPIKGGDKMKHPTMSKKLKGD